MTEKYHEDRQINVKTNVNITFTLRLPYRVLPNMIVEYIDSLFDAMRARIVTRYFVCVGVI